LIFSLFSRCILSNGHIEIWSQEDQVMLGRSETYMPINFFVDHEFYGSKLSLLQGLFN